MVLYFFFLFLTLFSFMLLLFFHLSALPLSGYLFFFDNGLVLQAFVWFCDTELNEADLGTSWGTLYISLPLFLSLFFYPYLFSPPFLCHRDPLGV